MKAVLHFNASARLRARVAALPRLQVPVIDEADDEGFAREMADAEVLLHVLKPVTAEMIAAAPKLRLIQKIGVGVNTIDRAAAHRAGVAVANMPGTNTQAVAEHTLALMLAALRRVPYLDAATRQGKGWSLSADSVEAVGEIAGRRVGFVGFGAVPQKLAPVLTALGADVRYWNRSARQSNLALSLELHELLETSDIVSLHVPATAETCTMIDSSALGRMKRGAILVNTARGELIDQVALAEALHDGNIIAAGLDVFAFEPATDLGRMGRCSTLVLTPHIAWLTPETIERSLAVVLDNCARLRDSRPLLNEIRYE